MLGPVMLDIEGLALTAEDREILCHPAVGGVILFARNYADRKQLGALTASIRALRTPQLIIAVDQEGGRVQRFRDDFVELPPLARLGELHDRDAATALSAVEAHAFVMVSELRAHQVDLSFAPVLDLRTRDSAVIGERAFHANADVVAHLAHRYVRTMTSCGMAAIGKHFPGHGAVAADSHLELPEDLRDFDDIERSDLRPFRALLDAGLGGIMMAHIRYPKVCADVAGYSQFWIRQLLREQMHFEGAVFSDDLAMAGAAVCEHFSDRAEAALNAGCDVLLICNQRQGAIEIIDKLGHQRFPLTQSRLMRLHARGEAASIDELRASHKWRAARDQLSRLIEAPELALGDDNLAQ